MSRDRRPGRTVRLGRENVGNIKRVQHQKPVHRVRRFIAPHQPESKSNFVSSVIRNRTVTTIKSCLIFYLHFRKNFLPHNTISSSRTPSQNTIVLILLLLYYFTKCIHDIRNIKCDLIILKSHSYTTQFKIRYAR